MTVHSKLLGDADRHFWINRSVARTLGVNLSEAMLEKDFSAKDYAALVTRCRTCDKADRCVAWLAGRSEGSDVAPDFCQNAETFNRLAQSKSARSKLRYRHYKNGLSEKVAE